MFIVVCSDVPHSKQRITVSAASKMLGNITYAYKGYGLSMGTMIAGWDHTVSYPTEVLSVITMLMVLFLQLGSKSSLCRQRWAEVKRQSVQCGIRSNLCVWSVRHGMSIASHNAPSTQILSFTLSSQHFKPDMSEEEACELGRRAIHHATHRDAYSGGLINVYLVKVWPDYTRAFSQYSYSTFVLWCRRMDGTRFL